MLHRSKANVIDLRNTAPRWATCDRDFEFAGKVIELVVAGEQRGDLVRQRRGVNQLVRSNSGERATGYVAHHIATCALGRKADCAERIHHFGQRLDSEPVQLNRLPHGDVGKIAGVLFGELGNHA